jgi:hypothetical protein
VRLLVALGTEQPGLLSRIAAVELIADPQRLGAAPYVWGTAPRQFSGLGVYATGLALPGVGFPVRDLPAQIQARSRSYCVLGDIVCAWDTDHNHLPEACSRAPRGRRASLWVPKTRPDP